MSTDDYNLEQLARGVLKPAHVTELVRLWQREHGLGVDGRAGAGETIPSIDAEIAARLGPAALPAARVYPLRALPDGRKPMVTSGFFSTNPDRPTHKGVDLFYQYLLGRDPAMRNGDGGKTGAWWIPDNTIAIACAPGIVTSARSTRTGFTAWVDHGRGWQLGYFHLSRLDVRVGQSVAAGSPLGVVGDNPADYDARHLHFELYFGELGQYPRGCRDPETWLKGATLMPAPR